jgi:hypothetical protein
MIFYPQQFAKHYTYYILLLIAVDSTQNDPHKMSLRALQNNAEYECTSKVQNIIFMALARIPTTFLSPCNLLSNYSASWFIWQWMIRNVLLTVNLQRPITFHYFTYWQQPAPILGTQKANNYYKKRLFIR